MDKIHDFCVQLEKIWWQRPELRFGQMMINMLGAYLTETRRDAFYVKDEDLLKFFQEYMQKHSPWAENN